MSEKLDGGIFRVAFLVGLEHGVRTVGSELLVGDDELVKSEPYGTTEAQLKTIRLSLFYGRWWG